MGFQKFTETGRGFKPQASIWSRGQISFNQGAVKRYKIDEFECAIMYYDSDGQLIGIELSNNKEAEGVHTIGKRKSGVMISAKAFLDYNDVDLSKTRKYDLKRDGETGFLVIDLKEKEKEKDNEA